MAPNFLSKFVKANGDSHPRARTISDIGDIRGRSASSSIDSKALPPSVVLTTENSDSPVAPSTPGSLHREDSSSRRARSVTLTPSSQSKDLPDIVSFPQTTSPEGAVPANPSMGLGIDLGQLPQLPEPALASHHSGMPMESSTTNGVEPVVKRKLSSKSLKSLKGQKIQQPQGDVPPVPRVQEIEASPKALPLVDSPTSDATPTTASFPAPSDSEILPPSTSTTSQASSLHPRARDSDAVSVSSAVSSNKKMPWRRGSAGSGKKRKPTGLASAITASGLAMANPGVAQSLASFAPQPSPRSQPNSPPQNSATRSRGPSNASHARSISNPEENDQFYSDLDSGSEDDLDDEIPVTGFAVASNKRNADFHEMFPSVPEGDYLIEDYGCALQREILIQGRLYISENHICFHANIFGWITDLIVPVYEIISIEKRMTALFIPNAIQITTRTAKYTFASFLSRDTTYDVIHNIWRLARPDAESIRSGEISTRVSLDDPGMLNEGGSSTAGTSLVSPLGGKTTICACGKNNQHFSQTCMSAVFPGTPEKIYNLMFASGYMKDFMGIEQGLRDLQISDWMLDPETKLLSRKYTYVKTLNGVVKQTKCELVDETLHCDFDDYITTLTTTRTLDVPSGSAFAVKTRTCIMWAGVAMTRVIVTTDVEWYGRSFIRAMINSSAVDGQKKYHSDLEKSMRRYIAAHKNEFVPEGMEEMAEAPITIEAVGPANTEETAIQVPLTQEEADRKREHERNQRATQWAFDTVMGAYKVAKQSTIVALDLVSDAWDQSTITTILYFLIVLLVFSNIWTFLKVGQREEVGRRKEMIKIEEQKKWVASIVAALAEERSPKQPSDFISRVVPSGEAEWSTELSDLNKALDNVEGRVQQLRRSIQDLD
ncbi:uncharacterized protein FOMMEDRAFT_149108 [Fomitiporia mediterranea MF3/22]|uniref:uncharacterized protein n=1 Tax=Fomitiporia mediterranea (strain MF3/22) TaxID=694068 RepID=UPI00044090B4|nr:uncharacterized protein FOMMEDRAFT_149108 [Fomitiporia mediterranea MF3/22]EJC98764.1 hypothetical protein FOMMEDRAFT_149108 [Fomitiporia mediterranea MF3/22]